MNPSVGELVEECDGTLRSCERFSFLARGREFQQEACELLAGTLVRAAKLKEEARSAADEDSANAVLAVECKARALLGELKMWLALKDDDPSAAWDHLVDAQMAASDAMQAHPLAGDLSGYVRKLHLIERLLFPPQQYMSVGIVIGSSQCSICGEEYGECGHIKRRPYMGELCGEIISEVRELHHIALVDDPASKRHRITHIGKGAERRDVMTWRVVGEPSGEAGQAREDEHSE